MADWLVLAVGLAVAARLVGLRERHALLLLCAMLLTTLVVAAATTYVRRPPPARKLAQVKAGFATSSACRSCHPQEYASWHASYHRRMTQEATLPNLAAAELARGRPLRADVDGRTVELYARRDQLWALLPGLYESSAMRETRVLLLTGSHHHQAFWIASARKGELEALPVVYSIDEQRLLPRRDAFLNPPDAPQRPVHWNSNCVQCHTVAGEPAHDEASDSFATRAVELGVACEACHGESEAHVEAMQNPLRRYAARVSATSQVLPVNPQGLSAERGAQVCGRCHSYFFPKHEAEWWAHGFARSFAPGQDLSQAQLLLSPETLAAPSAPQLGASAESLFYRDGTIRIGGREYNGLVRSPCFERGRGEKQLTCTSCHSLHAGAPNDQLDPEKLGNRACTQCHAGKAERLSEHTHHAATSPGSLCYNCHMPHVSYALLGAIRSHRVDSPSFDARTRDRPNACNLCHLEQSEAWAAAQARAWYGAKPALSLDRVGVLDAPAGAVFALTGDAAVRAVTAAALGRHESSDDRPALRAQLLDELSRDQYAAVRSIALRARPDARGGEQSAPLSQKLVAQLLALRDTRPVTLAE